MHAAIASSRPNRSSAVPIRRLKSWGFSSVDRASGDELARMFPSVRTAAIENRRFLQRATRFLTAEAGIRQFLDIGTGLPTADNTHEVAQAVAAESRVVYVDNDPMVMAHARALLTSTPEGKTTYIEDDLRRPEIAAALFDAMRNERLAIRDLAYIHMAVADPAGAKETGFLDMSIPEQLRDRKIMEWKASYKKRVIDKKK